MSLSTVMSPRIRAFLKPHIFYPDSCERSLKLPLETGFSDQIQLFSCEWKADSCKKSLRSQKYLDSCGYSLRTCLHGGGGPQVGEVTSGGGGVLLGILGGGVMPGSPNPDPSFRRKNVIFHTSFQTRPLKSIPVLRPGL